MRDITRPLAFKLAPGNETSKLARNLIDRGLIGLGETNPAILGMFRDRDVKPYRDMLPWSGEFAGKYLTSAYSIYRLTGNRNLYAYMLGFIDDLLACQDVDGYLGCYQRQCRLTGANSQDPAATGATWDAWSHYHVLYGLYLWYQETGNGAYLDAVQKAADLFINTFYNGRKRLVAIGSSEMNLAPLHIFALLYNETKDQRYLDFALEIVKDLEDEAAGNYINHSLGGLEFYQCPKPRWESLHVILGILELHRCTGQARYMDVAKQVFTSILKTDVHNTGAFSTDEMAIGHPYKNAAIETCCVVAYNALACGILAETSDSKVADFLELSLYNAVMGFFSPTGKWSTYNTPMEGTRCANYQTISWQGRPGSPDLNCCSVNAPRGLGMLSDWAVFESEGTAYINCFESLWAKTQSGLEVTIAGDYPANGSVWIVLKSDGPQRIAIRIPEWSKNTQVSLNGTTVQGTAGEYLLLERAWDNDALTIEFDFAVRSLDGDNDYKGKKSIYKGPLLFGYDLSTNPDIDFENIPALPLKDLEEAIPLRLDDGSIVLRLACGVVLTDFYHLGQSGCQYKTWLTVQKPD